MIKYLSIICISLILSSSCKNEGSNSNASTKASNVAQKQANQQPNNNQSKMNIAIFPGGANNSYTSIKLMEVFENAAGNDASNLFQQFWGISGGSIIASMFGSGNFTNATDAAKQFKDAAPKILDLNNIISSINISDLTNINNMLIEFMNDNNGNRRKNFKDILDQKIPQCEFNQDNKNKMVLITSVDKQPVIYADDYIDIPGYAKMINPISCSDAIIDSSNWQMPKNTIISLLKKQFPMIEFLADSVNQDFSLFKKTTITHEDKTFFALDGFYAQGADGNSPLPFAIDYVKSLNEADKTYNLVVFDNGSPSNQDFRNSLNLNDDTAIIKHDNNVTINIFIISIKDSQFGKNLILSDNNSFNYRDNLINNYSQNPQLVFNKAVEAVK